MKHFVVALRLVVPSVGILLACGPTPPAGTGGTGGGGTGGSGNPFCNVETVLQSKCQSCHSNPPIAGAPFPLVTYADTQANAPGTSTPIWQRMQARVTARTMPPAGAPALTDTEYNTMVNWFNGGAQGSDCGGGGSGGGGFGGVGPLPCAVTRQFKAHAPGNVNAKYNVAPGTINVYKCFTFRNPMYGTNEIITAQRPFADNLSVVHHFILFGVASGTDGAIQESGCVTPQLNGTQLDGWAPGGTNDIFPDDIGTRIEQPFVTLQIHYYTQSGGQDASGIEYCTTTQQRTNIAKVVTLGTDNISIPSGAQNYGVTGSCSGLPSGGSPVYVIGTSPHMHQIGSGFQTKVMKNGFLLSNIPLGQWRFDSQRHYYVDRYQMNPGDQTQTTCYYTNNTGRTVSFGPNTENEMCYDFLMVYPASAAKTECGNGITFSGF